MSQQTAIRYLLACALSFCLLVALIAPPGALAAEAPVCGSTSSTGDTVLGSLALDDDSSTAKTHGTAKVIAEPPSSSPAA